MGSPSRSPSLAICTYIFTQIRLICSCSLNGLTIPRLRCKFQNYFLVPLLIMRHLSFCAAIRTPEDMWRPLTGLRRDERPSIRWNQPWVRKISHVDKVWSHSVTLLDLIVFPDRAQNSPSQTRTRDMFQSWGCWRHRNKRRRSWIYKEESLSLGRQAPKITKEPLEMDIRITYHLTDVFRQSITDMTSIWEPRRLGPSLNGSLV